MHAAEICVCRPGWIKDKTGERLTRTEAGPAAQGWGFVRMRRKFAFAVRDG